MLCLSSCATTKKVKVEEKQSLELNEQIKTDKKVENTDTTVVNLSKGVDESTLEDEETTVITTEYEYTPQGEQRVKKQEVKTTNKRKKQQKAENLTFQQESNSNEKVLLKEDKKLKKKENSKVKDEQNSKVESADFSWLWKLVLSSALLLIALAVYKYRK